MQHLNKISNLVIILLHHYSATYFKQLQMLSFVVMAYESYVNSAARYLLDKGFVVCTLILNADYDARQKNLIAIFVYVYK